MIRTALLCVVGLCVLLALPVYAALLACALDEILGTDFGGRLRSWIDGRLGR